MLQNLNPVWNEEWWLCNVPLGAGFDIGIWDYDFMKRDDSIGVVNFNFSGEVYFPSSNKFLDCLLFYLRLEN